MGKKQVLFIDLNPLANRFILSFQNRTRINKFIDKIAAPAKTSKSIDNIYIATTQFLKFNYGNYPDSEYVKELYPEAFEEDKSEEDSNENNSSSGGSINISNNRQQKQEQESSENNGQQKQNQNSSGNNQSKQNSSESDNKQKSANIVQYDIDVKKINFTSKIKQAIQELSDITTPSDEVIILLDCHGGVIGKEHYISYQIPTHDASKMTRDIFIKTKELFEDISAKFTNNQNLQFGISSCFAGFAQNYIDILPKGAKLYTVTDETNSEGIGASNYGYDNYPENSGFELKQYCKTLLDYTESNYRFLIVENILEGISGEGVFKFQFNSREFDNGNYNEVYQKANELYQNEIIGHNNLVNLVKLLKHIHFEKDGFGSISKETEWFFNLDLTKIALLCDKKVKYNPSRDKVKNGFEVDKLSIRSEKIMPILVDSESLEYKIIHNKNINILEILGNKTKGMSDSDKLLSQRRDRDLLDMIEYYCNKTEKKLSRYSCDTMDINLTVGVTLDHSGEKFITIFFDKADKLVGNNFVANSVRIINIKLTDEEASNLIGGDKTNLNMFDFLYNKSCRILDDHAITKFISQERLKSLKDSLARDSLCKLISKKIEKILNDVIHTNQLSQLDLKDDYDLVIQTAKYNASKEDKDDQPVIILEYFSDNEKFIKYIPEEGTILSYDEIKEECKELEVVNERVVDNNDNSANSAGSTQNSDASREQEDNNVVASNSTNQNNTAKSGENDSQEQATRESENNTQSQAQSSKNHAESDFVSKIKQQIEKGASEIDLSRFLAEKPVSIEPDKETDDANVAGTCNSSYHAEHDVLGDNGSSEI